MTKKKDKILPIKIWLDEESCWNNEPQYSKGYVEYVREDYHAQALLHVLQKGKEFGKLEMLENALDAYCKVCSNYGSPTPLNICRQECKNYSDFKKAMED